MCECVYVCACVCARARVCVCVCVMAYSSSKEIAISSDNQQLSDMMITMILVNRYCCQQ